MKGGWFVTGTDTGVGKTFVSCGFISSLVERGHRVSVMKPCETGDGNDAELLRAATLRPLDLSLVRPYHFALPASPACAAAAANVTIDLARIRAAFDTLASDTDLMLVEGAGGLLVPLDATHTMADLAALLALPLLIVARPSLGTINHTLLTIEAARHRRLPIAGVIFSRTTPPGPEEPSTPATIAHLGQVPILGTIERGGDGIREFAFRLVTA